MSEHDEQCAVIQWAKIFESRYPELALLFAIPNGGKRNVVTAMKLRDEGVKPGVPDLFLPVARHGWHGMFIEMKFGRNKTTPEQFAVHRALIEQGYGVWVCYSADGAIEAIRAYLEMEA
jgi:hypothetical protein